LKQVSGEAESAIQPGAGEKKESKQQQLGHRELLKHFLDHSVEAYSSRNSASFWEESILNS
jgi:hypothetical protein